jgi:hypothetical protein
MLSTIVASPFMAPELRMTTSHTTYPTSRKTCLPGLSSFLLLGGMTSGNGTLATKRRFDGYLASVQTSET